MLNRFPIFLLLSLATTAVAHDGFQVKSAASFHGLFHRANEVIKASTYQSDQPNKSDNHYLRHLEGMGKEETCMAGLVSCKSDLADCNAAAAAPTYLFVQMAHNCTLSRSANADGTMAYTMSTSDMDDETYSFSDRPFQFENEIPTEEFFANFTELFNTSKPNAAFTFDLDDDDSLKFEGPVVAVQVDAIYEDDSGVYSYVLEQSASQASVSSLESFFEDGEGDDVMFEACNIFIDDSSGGDDDDWVDVAAEGIEDAGEYIADAAERKACWLC